MIGQIIYFNPRSLTGATHAARATCAQFSISIHAPSRKRLYQKVKSGTLKDFNPRSLTGATAEPKQDGQQPQADFNPRSLTGATIFTSFLINCLSAFQSTLPHGSDQQTARLLLSGRDFNPRSLTGATEQHPETSDRTADFNPRSLTGATTLRMRSQYICHISIHAPSRERRRPSTREFVLYIFQSTLPHGSDQPPSYQDFVAYRISIHAPSRERRCTAHRVS